MAKERFLGNIFGQLEKTFGFPLSNISNGMHTITIRAEQSGYYEDDSNCYFNIESSLNFTFTIDDTPPNVSILLLENQTFRGSNVPLNFEVNESVSQLSYSLDGQRNVTVAGNTTLSDLSYGDHSLRIYATDIAGNVGASKTVYFKVEAPEAFPSLLVVSAILAVAVSAGLIIYFKKRDKDHILGHASNVENS